MEITQNVNCFLPDFRISLQIMLTRDIYSMIINFVHFISISWWSSDCISRSCACNAIIATLWLDCSLTYSLFICSSSLKSGFDWRFVSHTVGHFLTLGLMVQIQKWAVSVQGLRSPKGDLFLSCAHKIIIRALARTGLKKITLWDFRGSEGAEFSKTKMLLCLIPNHEQHCIFLLTLHML